MRDSLASSAEPAAPDRPQRLRPTLVSRRYRGGALLAAWRGDDPTDSLCPEDWIGSTTLAKDGGASGREGLSELLSGQPLRDAIARDPSGWLGAAHVNALGADPSVLVKALDAAERLPVHAHPSRSFAQVHLGSHFGKTEAWIVVAQREGRSDPMWLGMREAIDPAEFLSWILEQRSDRMLAAMNEVSVRPGDVLFVPGGVPHAIGGGALVVELQEPTDFSLHCETAGFAVRAVDAHDYGIGWELALQSLELGRFEPIVRHDLPREADGYFTLATSPPNGRFCVAIAIDGTGSFAGEPVTRGDTFAIPAVARDRSIEGSVSMLFCGGPNPERADRTGSDLDAP